MTESATMRALQLAATERGGRLFRNNVAEGWVGKFIRRNNDGSVLIGNARVLHAGLAIGSGDLIGIAPVVITAEMIGQTIGRFASVETKSATGRLSTEQSAWLDMVRRLGGVARECRSVEDLEGLL